MSEKQGNGICLFCYNNEQLDYSKFAMLASTYAKKHLDLPVTLITDDGTKDWMEQNHSQDEIDACFDLMVIDNSGVASKRNMRKHMDSPWTEFNAPFFNSNKHSVFYHTPYERTLLLDTDYILGNDFYKYIFDTDEPLALHRYAQYIGGELPYRNEITLNEASELNLDSNTQHLYCLFNEGVHVKKLPDFVSQNTVLLLDTNDEMIGAFQDHKAEFFIR